MIHPPLGLVSHPPLCSSPPPQTFPSNPQHQHTQPCTHTSTALLIQYATTPNLRPPPTSARRASSHPTSSFWLETSSQANSLRGHGLPLPPLLSVFRICLKTSSTSSPVVSNASDASTTTSLLAGKALTTWSRRARPSTPLETTTMAG